jgi:hypothetical protein
MPTTVPAHWFLSAVPRALRTTFFAQAVWLACEVAVEHGQPDSIAIRTATMSA